MLDFSTDWTDGIIEVWKGQTRALIPLISLSLVFAGVTYVLNTNYWTLGVALAGLLFATFVMMSISAGFWVLSGKLWSKYVPKEYHLTEQLKQYPLKARTAVVVLFTMMFFVLIYFAYSLSPDARVVLGASGEPLIVGLKEFMYVVLGILAILIASMWYKHYKIVQGAREAEDE